MLLTHEGRLKGNENSVKQRRLKRDRRREEVKELHADGLKKTQIAKQMGVSLRTIIEDLKN